MAIESSRTAVRYGSRARITALCRRVTDVIAGNRDGVVGNECLPANHVMQRGKLATVLDRLTPLFEGRARFERLEASLDGFVAGVEQRWQRPVTNLVRPEHVSPADWATFRVNKAVTLERFGLEPSDISEHLVVARGGMDGVSITPRVLFAQRFRPLAPWNGVVVVIAPGYGQTTRNFVEQALLAARAGYEVVAFDQQWLGLSQGQIGAVDRGFGVARDIAAVAAEASARRPGALTIVAGTSMGALGALIALRMQELGRLALENAPPMPSRLGAVLQSTFLGLSPRLACITRVADRLPFVPRIAVPRLRVGGVTDDPVAGNKLLATAAIEGAMSRGQAFHAADDDRERLALLDATEPSAADASPIHMIHSARDALADHAATAQWCRALGPRARLVTLDSGNHFLAESPSEQRPFIAELDAAVARMRGQTVR